MNTDVIVDAKLAGMTEKQYDREESIQGTCESCSTETNLITPQWKIA
jgi:hypothetical protein